MNLKYAYLMAQLGRLDTTSLPELAVRALEGGVDSPSLRRLAVTPATESENATHLFLESVKELNFPLLTEEEARLALARQIAQGIVDGSIKPYEGARRIWWELWTNCRSLQQLAIFAGLASEFEDDTEPSHREAYSRDILEAANRLMSETTNLEWFCREYAA